MKSYDTVIFASWPKGLYLAQKLQRVYDQKVGYIECSTQTLPPLGLFLDKEKDKDFFESQGVVLQKQGGFSFLNSKGQWNFQEALHLKSQKLSQLNHWLPFLSHNLMGTIFEYNNFKFSEDYLDLFSDYYLFTPSLKKKKKEKESSCFDWKTLSPHSKVNWYADHFSMDNEDIKAQKIVFLNDEESESQLSLSTFSISPEWKWKKFSFSGDIGGYKEIVPCHFVCINNLSLPWTHDNLLNVFQDRDRWDVWLRLPARSFLEQEKKEVVHSLLHSLESYFKGTHFHFIKEGEESFFVYGKERLNQMRKLPTSFPYKNTKSLFFKDVNFFSQADLGSHLKGERRLLKKVLSYD